MTIRSKELDKYIEKASKLASACTMFARYNEGDSTTPIYLVNIVNVGDSIEIHYVIPRDPRNIKVVKVLKVKMTESLNS